MRGEANPRSPSLAENKGKDLRVIRSASLKVSDPCIPRNDANPDGRGHASGHQIKGCGSGNSSRSVSFEKMECIDVDNEPEPPKRIQLMQTREGNLPYHTTPTKQAKFSPRNSHKGIHHRTAYKSNKVMSKGKARPLEPILESVNAAPDSASNGLPEFLPELAPKAKHASSEVKEILYTSIFSEPIKDGTCLGIPCKRGGSSRSSYLLEVKELKDSSTGMLNYVLEISERKEATLISLPGHSNSQLLVKATFNSMHLGEATLTLPDESGKLFLSKSNGELGGHFEATLENSKKLEELLWHMNEHFPGLKVDLRFTPQKGSALAKYGHSIPSGAVAEELSLRHREDSKLFGFECDGTSESDAMEVTPHSILLNSPRPAAPPPPASTAPTEKEFTDEPSYVAEIFKGIEPSRYPLRSQKTINLDSPEPAYKAKPPSTPLLFEYPTVNGVVRVHEGDRDRLRAKEFLNDVVIEFYLNYTLKNSKNPTPLHLLSTFLYPQLLRCRRDPGGNFKRLDPWVKGPTLFAKEFILVPIIESYHWYLVILGRLNTLNRHAPDASSTKLRGPPKRSAQLKPPFTPACKAGPKPICIEIDDSDTALRPMLPPRRVPSEPWIAILNSMETGNHHVADVFRDYIVHLANRDLNLDPSNLSLWLFSHPFHPPVPQQKNGYDCGIYLLEFAENFMSNPYFYEDLILRTSANPDPTLRNPQPEWCQDAKLQCKRRDIIKLIDDLSKLSPTTNDPSPPGSDVEILDDLEPLWPQLP
ncbi:Sentrin-specific protease 6 [Massospora cicadina]|nr:Sentrin-specific protease 6 [Massospora cicadina]